MGPDISFLTDTEDGEVVSLSMVKSIIGISGNDKDTKIQSLIDSAVIDMSRVLGYELGLKRAKYKIHIMGNDMGKIQLPITPIERHSLRCYQYINGGSFHFSGFDDLSCYVDSENNGVVSGANFSRSGRIAGDVGDFVSYSDGLNSWVFEIYGMWLTSGEGLRKSIPDGDPVLNMTPFAALKGATEIDFFSDAVEGSVKPGYGLRVLRDGSFVEEVYTITNNVTAVGNSLIGVQLDRGLQDDLDGTENVKLTVNYLPREFNYTVSEMVEIGLAAGPAKAAMALGVDSIEADKYKVRMSGSGSRFNVLDDLVIARLGRYRAPAC